MAKTFSERSLPPTPKRSPPQTLFDRRSLTYDSLTFSPDGRKLAVMADEGKVGFLGAINWGFSQIVDLEVAGGEWTEQPLGKYGPMYHCYFSHVGASFSPDSSKLFVLSPQSGRKALEYSLLDGASGQPIRSIEHERTFPVESYCFSRDGRFFACGGWKYVPADEKPNESPLEYGGGESCAWELATGRLIVRESWDKGDACLATCFSPDGKTLAVSGGRGKWGFKRADIAGEVRLFDMQTGERRLSLAGHESPVSAVAFSSDGGMFVSADLMYCAVKFWEMRLGREVGSLSLAQVGLPWTIRHIALSPDGQLLAVAMANFNRGQNEGKVCVIDVTSKATIAVLLEHSADPIYCVAFSPDGAMLAACGYKTLKLWDIASD